MTIVDLKKLDLLNLLETCNYSIDTFLITKVHMLIENEANVRLQQTASESLSQDIKVKLNLLNTTWFRLEEKDREIFRAKLKAQFFRFTLKPYDYLPGTLSDYLNSRYEACKARLDIAMQENVILDCENKLLKAQINLLNEQLTQKDSEISLVSKKMLVVQNEQLSTSSKQATQTTAENLDEKKEPQKPLQEHKKLSELLAAKNPNCIDTDRKKLPQQVTFQMPQQPMIVLQQPQQNMLVLPGLNQQQRNISNQSMLVFQGSNQLMAQNQQKIIVVNPQQLQQQKSQSNLIVFQGQTSPQFQNKQQPIVVMQMPQQQQKIVLVQNPKQQQFSTAINTLETTEKRTFQNLNKDSSNNNWKKKFAEVIKKHKDDSGIIIDNRSESDKVINVQSSPIVSKEQTATQLPLKQISYKKINQALKRKIDEIYEKKMPELTRFISDSEVTKLDTKGQEIKELTDKINRIRSTKINKKSFYECSVRQRFNLRKQIRQMLIDYLQDYLTGMCLCIHQVIIYPIELDECEFKLEIKEFHECVENKDADVNKLLYHKDKFSISDKAYNDLKSKCGLDVPSLYHIRTRRNEIDNIYELIENNKGVFVSAKAKIRNRVEAFFQRKYQMSDPESFKNPDFTDEILHIRLAADGTNIGRNLKLLNFTFTILNEGPRSRTANGNYTLGIYELEMENYDNLLICFAELVEEIGNLKEMKIGEHTISLVFYYSGDWKMLAQCLGIQSANSKYPCVWCKCCKDDFTNKNFEWSISDAKKGARSHEELIKTVQLPNNSKTIKYGYDKLPIFKDVIPINRYMIDMLHLFLRISDSLINLLVKDCTLIDNFESWTISRFDVSEYKHLHAFQKFLNDSCRVNFKFVWLSDSKKLTWRDLVGPEKIRVFENFDLKQIIPEHDKLESLQKLWIDFYNIIKHVKLVEISHTDLKTRTQEWLDLFLTIYNKTTVTPYIHAFVSHLHEFVELYKDINAFNLQGLERLNEMTTSQYFKGTNKGDTALHQIMRKRNRMEYLRLFIDDPDMDN